MLMASGSSSYPLRYLCTRATVATTINRVSRREDIKLGENGEIVDDSDYGRTMHKSIKGQRYLGLLKALPFGHDLIDSITTDDGRFTVQTVTFVNIYPTPTTAFSKPEAVRCRSTTDARPAEFTCVEVLDGEVRCPRHVSLSIFCHECLR